MTITGALGLAQGAMMDYELDAPGTSDLILAGNLALNGQQFSDFDFTWTSNFGPGTYDLIESGSVPSGVLGNSTSGTIDGYSANLAVQGDDLVLDVSPTPEPSTLALLAAGALGLLVYGWRRRATRTAKPAAFDQEDAPAILSFPSQASQAHMVRRAG